MDKSEYKFVKPDEFAYNPARINVGSIAFNDLGKTVIVSSLYVIIHMCEELDNEFALQYIKSPEFLYEVRRNTEGSVREYLFYENFSNVKLPYTPNLEEQQKIGIFFKELDNLIALHQRKYDALILLKKAYLQNLFPKKGESVPKLRFNNFDKDWEQHKLKTVVDVHSGRDYKHLLDGNIPVYGTGGYMLSVNEALSYNEDAIGIGRKGTIDKPFLLRAPFWTVDTLFYVIPKEKHDLYFIYSIFQRINWKRKDESTGVPSLSKMTINGVNITISNNEEQIKIGGLFKSLDNLIDFHKVKLDKLHNLKKVFLQIFFV